MPNGATYRWELERDGTELELAVTGPVTTNDPRIAELAELSGLLCLLSEPAPAEPRAARLRRGDEEALSESACTNARDLYAEIRPASARVASEFGHGGQNMRVHFQQLTEPIAPLLDDDHELFEFALDPFASQILTPPQLKSQAPRSRRLQMPRACGDPIHSSLVTA
jgi:hypothetical protein